MPAAYRGNCPVCGGNYALTKDGKLGVHPAPAPEFADENGKCRGKRQLPVK